MDEVSIEVDRVMGRPVTAKAVAGFSNCTLKAMRARAQAMLANIEEELDRRMLGKINGGQK